MKTKTISKSQITLIGIIMIFILAITLKNSSFLSLGNAFDILRSGTVTGMFALTTMMLMISGGIDVSFPAIASLSMYASVKLVMQVFPNMPIILIFVVASLIGALLGALNGFIIGKFRLQTLIVTLGTSAIFKGFMLTFLGADEISNLPKQLSDFGRLSVWTVTSKQGVQNSVSVTLFIFIFIAILIWFILNHTIFGYSVYAIGGDEVAAKRSGIPVLKVKIILYSFSGCIAGIAGIVHTSLMRNCNPVNLLGSEMLIIAAVVVGGTSIAGGKGNVFGTLLGVLLIVIVSNNLIMLGVPSTYQRIAIGSVLILGTLMTVLNKGGKKHVQT